MQKGLIYKIYRPCKKCHREFLAKGKTTICSRCKSTKKHNDKKRPKIPVIDKKMVYYRDQYQCRICRKNLTDNPIDMCCIKVNKRKRATPDNLATVCRKCVFKAKKMTLDELNHSLRTSSRLAK